MIPQLFHITYKNEDSLSLYSTFLDQMKKLHPKWQFNLYNDLEARAIVAEHFNEYLKMYDEYKHPIQRADVFRVMIVYLQGGFYVDLDMQLLKPLDDLLQHQIVVAEEKTLSAEECMRLKHLFPLRIANYMFASEAYHPFWIDVLKMMYYKRSNVVLNENDILETTGPGLLTNVFHTSKKNYPEIYLLENKTKLCLKKCSKIPSCHFGDYAAHWHHGSWRWQNSNFIQKQKL